MSLINRKGEIIKHNLEQLLSEHFEKKIEVTGKGTLYSPWQYKGKNKNYIITKDGNIEVSDEKIVTSDEINANLEYSKLNNSRKL